MPPPNLPVLLTMARGGDRSAFNVLITYYGPRVVRYVTAMGLPSELAEETAQEVFIDVWEDRARLKTPGFFFKKATWRALNDRKKLRNRAGILDDISRWLLDWGGKPATEDTRTGIRLDLDGCLDGLEPDERAVLLLCLLEGLTAREVAESGPRDRRIRPARTAEFWPGPT